MPLPLSTKFTPVGSVPVEDSAGAGAPLVVTLKVPDLAVVKVAVVALVMAGVWVTTSEKRLDDRPGRVLGRDLEGVGLGRARSGGAREGGRAVAVVDEGHPVGSVPVAVSAASGSQTS